MNNWMKMGMAGMALAGSLHALAQEEILSAAQKESTLENDLSGFSIEASDLIAGKLRDYLKEEQSDKPA